VINYYGQTARMDRQGRVLIQPLLRERAQMSGEVAILGQQRHLDVWNRSLFEARLKSKGASIVLTRTTESARPSNIERAIICSRARASLFLRLHADGNPDRSKKGFSVLYPARNRWTTPIFQESRRAAGIFRVELRTTGAPDLGLRARGDLTGFNWSKTTAVLTELGFLSNPEEDRLLASPGYQEKLVSALARAVEAYLVTVPKR